MIDSHTHLEVCEPDDAELVADAVAAGVEKLLTIGMDGDSGRVALAQAERFPEVGAAVGRHPNGAEGWDEDGLAELRELVADPRCLAIGETGLDFFRDRAPRADQLRAFRDHIDLARELDKPLIIHTRDAADETLATLNEHAGGVRVILHCFSMPERLEECLAHDDWWISFAGNVTYPKNEALRAAAARVPLDRLLVETDAPFLTPQAVRKQRNQPAFVVHTARAVAAERGMSLDELDVAVTRNAAEVLGW